MKQEAFRRIIVSLSLPVMQAELDLYCRWCNAARPHQSLACATPAEVLKARPPAIEEPGFSVLPDIRDEHERAPPELRLVISHAGGRAHLPIVELRRAT